MYLSKEMQLTKMLQTIQLYVLCTIYIKIIIFLVNVGVYAPPLFSVERGDAAPAKVLAQRQISHN